MLETPIYDQLWIEFDWVQVGCPLNDVLTPQLTAELLLDDASEMMCGHCIKAEHCLKCVCCDDWFY